MKNKFLLKNVMARLAGSAAIGLLALGIFGGSPALAGIASTKHNLGSSSSATNPNRFSGTTEVCVFCHTPHGADATASVPLWNKTLPTAATYTTYNSLGTSSLDGATMPVGSVSIACLSCHDGVQAMNTVINAPGSGLTNAAWTAGAWTTGTGKVTGVANLTANLNNDHPIGIQYGGGMVNNAAYTAGAIASAAFKDKDFVGLQYASLNGNSVWWVDSGTTAGQRDKGDMQLYTRVGATALSGTSSAVTGTVLTGAQAFVECGSCHDPHVDNTVTFLRISNANSAVCLACHIK